MDYKAETAKELEKIPWFKEISPDHLQKIAEISHLRHVRAGEILFREGDNEDFLYIVIEGRVALDFFIPHRGKVRIYTVEPQDVFGWSSVTPIIRKRTAGAVAVVDGLVNLRFRFDKRFHVSPFMPMDHGYDWRFSEPGPWKFWKSLPAGSSG